MEYKKAEGELCVGKKKTSHREADSKEESKAESHEKKAKCGNATTKSITLHANIKIKI